MDIWSLSCEKLTGKQKEYNISSLANKDASCRLRGWQVCNAAAVAAGDVGGRLMEAARCRQVSARWRMTDRC